MLRFRHAWKIRGRGDHLGSKFNSLVHESRLTMTFVNVAPNDATRWRENFRAKGCGGVGWRN